MDAARRKIINDAVARSAEDPAFFLRFFLSNWFPSPLPAVHLGLLALRTRKVAFLNAYPEAHSFLLNHFNYERDPRDPDSVPEPVFTLGEDGMIYMSLRKNLNVVIPRGFSKTTLMKGATLYDSATDGLSFGCFVSAAGEHAESQLNDVKIQFELNELLKLGYGELASARSDPGTWNSRKLHLKNGAIIIARGRSAQIRGLTEDGRRPNSITLDDVEDEESVATQPQRKKTVDWLYGSVVPAGQYMEGAVGEEWAQRELQILNLGTLLGPECLLQTVASDPEFGTIRFGARVEPGLMLWPYKMTETGYTNTRNRYRRTGQLAQFTKEYDSAIRVDESALFPSSFIPRPVAREELVSVSIALDPAISPKRRADHSAIIVAGRHKSGHLWFLEEWGGIGKTPTELVDNLFRLHLKWGANLVGIEAIAYQAALLHITREEMMKRRTFFALEAISAPPTRKETRIEGVLSPRYKNGYLHHYTDLPNLESNLLDWPNGKKDYADAATMALNLLGESAGLLMEGGDEPMPALPPAPLFSDNVIGNYIHHSRNNRLPPSKNPRYGSTPRGH